MANFILVYNKEWENLHLISIRISFQIESNYEIKKLLKSIL